MTTTINLPTYTDSVDLRWFIEPLGGPIHPANYLDRFPDEVYTKSPDSHFVRFMYSLLGPAGVGWLKKNALEVRLKLEDSGFEAFDLERFYGDPFQFGRIVEEVYDEDPTGLLPRDVWDQIKARDEAYRSRAIAFFNAARLGSSPEGMRLAAQSGLGHPAEIVENYQYLFDNHSDDPLGLQYYGKTLMLNEFVVVPRQEISRTVQQVISAVSAPTAGSYVLTFNGQSTTNYTYLSVTYPAIPWNASILHIQAALSSLPGVGTQGVTLSGGPLGVAPIVVTFTGTLSNQDLPLITASSALVTGSTPVTLTVSAVTGNVDSTDESIVIPDRDRHHLQVALDYLRPVASFPSFYSSPGKRSRQPILSTVSSSHYAEVVRFVTGSSGVNWPTVDTVHWIERGKEKQAPRAMNDRQFHYSGFHNIANVQAYTDLALSDAAYHSDPTVVRKYLSEHAGRFDNDLRHAMQFFANFDFTNVILTADRVKADYAEPLTVTSQSGSGTPLINGIYPVDYSGLAGVPTLKYKDDHFWSSLERDHGGEVLEIDLGSAQAVNFITFDITRKPVDIAIEFDVSTSRNFIPVTPQDGFPWPDGVHFDPAQQSPWLHSEYYFTDQFGDMIYTRYIRLTFTRRITGTSTDFLRSGSYQTPWAVDVKNLRVGRNVSNI